MRAKRSFSLILGLALTTPLTATAVEPRTMLPKAAEGWSVELVTKAPDVVFPTAIVAAPDGTLYVGQDPMDMPGPPTVPRDSVVAIRKDGKVTVFAEGLWAVMGLEWVDDALYVVHAPFLSAFRDKDGDGKADRRVDLITGLGPRTPGFNGINDHIASGLRLAMDGFLYLSVGDKGIPKGVGKDGTVIQLFGGGVIRVRPDGTGLEVVSTGERNPLSVALSARDDIFTYGNDDDSKTWPNSLTHHIVGGHYGYPFQFLNAPRRALPIMAGEVGGSGAQGLCFNEDGLPAAYRGNLLVCDWGLQAVFRYEIEPKGGTFAVKAKTPFVTKGELNDFRPFSLAVAPDRASVYLVDWGFNGWLADGPKTGRVFRLTYHGPDRAEPAPAPAGNALATRLDALDHPAHSVRMESQRLLSRRGEEAVLPLSARLRRPGSATGRIHALWALDAIASAQARDAIRNVLTDPDPAVRAQAARSCGIRRDRAALAPLITLLKDSDAVVRREAAIALGRTGDGSTTPALLAALGDPDTFVAWSVRRALRTINVWEVEPLTEALCDAQRRDDALALCDENWARPVVTSLVAAVPRTDSSEARARMVATLGGLARKYPAWSGRWFGTNPLAGPFPQKTEPWDGPAMASVQAGLTDALRDKHATVRIQAIAGLLMIGRPAAPALRALLSTEDDPKNLAALARGLGALADFPSASSLGQIVRDASTPEFVRVAALDALGNLRGPLALKARLMLVYDEKAPASLLARALPALGRDGILPPNDLLGFLDHAEPAVRVAALEALAARKKVPDEVRRAVVKTIDDPSPEVRRAAAETVARLDLRDAVPKLLALALQEDSRADAMRALAAMPDPRALPLYLAALRDKNAEVRTAGENALLAIREDVSSDLDRAARSGKYHGPAAQALERVVTRFKPVIDWKVIGPFPRTIGPLFSDPASIDFSQTHPGAAGHTLAWQTRRADSRTGRLVIDDFKAGAGDRGGFGYDDNATPDLGAFAYAEVPADRDRDALFRLGSSGSLTVTLNGEPVHNHPLSAGRGYAPDSDLVRVRLHKGVNRVLMVTRQGLGAWSFGLQVSEPTATALALPLAEGARGTDRETLRAFALSHEGDPKNGEAIFFDARGIGCANCHAAGGKGAAHVGPNLSGLALQYDKAEIIRSVLEPSSRIANGYQPWIVATRDGKVVSGLLRAETDTYLDLEGSDRNLIRIATSEIEARRVGDVSIMPTGLVDALSPVEFVDLISYLQSLKSAPASTAASLPARRPE